MTVCLPFLHGGVAMPQAGRHVQAKLGRERGLPREDAEGCREDAGHTSSKIPGPMLLRQIPGGPVSTWPHRLSHGILKRFVAAISRVLLAVGPHPAALIAVADALREGDFFGDEGRRVRGDDHSVPALSIFLMLSRSSSSIALRSSSRWRAILNAPSLQALASR